MDGLGRAVGDGLGSIMRVAFEGIGGGLRALVAFLDRSLPGGALLVAASVVLLGFAWVLARR